MSDQDIFAMLKLLTETQLEAVKQLSRLGDLLARLIGEIRADRVARAMDDWGREL